LLAGGGGGGSPGRRSFATMVANRLSPYVARITSPGLAHFFT
jgi:hypothetical protein